MSAEPLDVVVVGAGLAGVTAALRLRESNLRVGLSHAAPGHTATFSGSWKWGVSRALTATNGASSEALPLEHVRDIALHEPHHPFARMGAETAATWLAQGARSVANATTGYLSHSALERAYGRIPLSRGVVEWGCPHDGIATWPMKAGEMVAVIDAAAWGAPLHERVLLGWQHDAAALKLPACHWQSVALDPLPSLPTFASAHAAGLARYLESEAGFDAMAHALATSVPEEVQEIWLPSVLGLHPSLALLEKLETRLGKRVREVAASDGLVPGVRRERALTTALSQHGIFTLPKTLAVAPDAQGVQVQLQGHAPVHTRAMVLATGRFVGGGLVWKSQHRCVESLFGWELTAFDVPAHERSPLDMTSPLARAPHAIEAAGVPTDAHGQPLVRQALAAPLTVAGGLLGGWHERSTPSADGVALATGICAAQTLLDALGKHVSPLKKDSL